MRTFVLVAIGMSLLAVAAPANACTTFLVGDSVGKCYDWSMGQGMVVLNPRGLAKQAMPMLPTDQPARWNAEHASLTFNQYGREMPNGGINDSGLVVEVMWLDSTRLPPVDSRPTVNELQWIQYALDRWSTVAELTANANDLRVSRVSGRVHYLACDRTHQCAAFEFVDGKLVISQGKDLVVPVLTNNTYATSSAKLRNYTGFGGKEPIPNGTGSLDRFVRAASLDSAGKDAWQVLESVQNADSQWQIVYDVKTLQVSWRSRARTAIKHIDFAHLASSCDQPVKMIDINTELEGDVGSKLVPYTEAADRTLVEQSLAGMGLLPGTPARLAHYPELLACTAK
jgi:choloylglycine hydrolase